MALTSDEFAELQERYNKIIVEWSKMTRGELIQSMHRFSIGQKFELLKSLKRMPRTKKNSGQIEKVSFNVTMGGIYTQYGVGKGIKIKAVEGSNRKAKKWISPVLETKTEALADLLAKEFEDTELFKKLNIKAK